MDRIESLLDDATRYVLNIVEDLEDKVAELEEKLSEKDQTISNLKDEIERLKA